MLGDVYYDSLHEAAFGTLEKLKRVAKKTRVAKPDQVKPWLEQQDAYTPSPGPRAIPEKTLQRR